MGSDTLISWPSLALIEAEVEETEAGELISADLCHLQMVNIRPRQTVLHRVRTTEIIRVRAIFWLDGQLADFFLIGLVLYQETLHQGILRTESS